MTQTSTATANRIYSVPNAGLVHVIGEVEITLNPHTYAGFLLRGSRNGVHAPDLCGQFNHSDDAIRAFTAAIARVEAEQVEAAAEKPAKVEAPATVHAIPGNVGTMQRVSDPAHTVLALAATHPAGIVEQGGKLGQATRTQIRSLARKGYLVEIYEQGRNDARKVIEAGRITAKGRKRLAELTAADSDAARLNAALAA
jgi:plastocyanin